MALCGAFVEGRRVPPLFFPCGFLAGHQRREGRECSMVNLKPQMG